MEGKKKVAAKNKVSKKKKATTKKSSKKKKGTVSKWQDSFGPIIMNLMKDGYTNLEIAQLMSIDEKTFYNWKKAHPEHFQSEDAWKAMADEEAERTLVKLLKGYKVVETKVFCTKSGAIKTHDVIKQYPPNQKSLEFYLTNRKGKDWKNKIEHEMGDDMSRSFSLKYKQGDSEINNKEKENVKEESKQEKL